MTVPLLSVVVPVFNEADSLRPLVGELLVALDPLALAYELVLVDDGSTDASADVLKQLAESQPALRVVRLARNSGQSAALGAGFRAARGEIVITLDADLQNDPADIPRLLEALDECDVVSGIRIGRRDTLVRRVSSRIANRVRDLVLHDGVTDVGCSLKAYRARFLDGLPVFNGMHRFLPALVKMRGARIKEIPVGHRPRVHGVSKYTINNRLWRGIADLVGVRWLQRRWVDIRLAQEIETWTSTASGSSSDSQAKGSSSLDSSSSGSPRSERRGA